MFFSFSLFFACSPEPKPSQITTYYQDVLPVLEKNCLRCHRGEGPGIGDFSDPETVVQLSELMLSSIESGRMPPSAAAA